MTREDVLAKLREAFPDLQARYALQGLSVFGSTARNEAKAGSDIDLLVTFESGRPCGFFAFFALRKELEGLLGASIDLVTLDALKPQMKDRILAEAIRAA